MKLQVGLDIGSTTAKMVVLNEEHQLVFKSYLRHFSEIKQTVINLLNRLAEKFPSADLHLHASGSSGISLSEQMGIPFVQEVVACTQAVKERNPNSDVVIELGGEDAKIIYLTNGMEQRMNSACAGGTGAFIDQIASLLQTDAAGLNQLASKSEKIYPIASRCGVFAKTDIQALINDGVRREDIAASVFQAVVNQTISGLACGRPIRGNVAFLGGPLTFLPELRHRFMVSLNLTEEHVMADHDGQYFVAIGAAMERGKHSQIRIESLIRQLKVNAWNGNKSAALRMSPLFENKGERTAFERRHAEARVPRGSLATYSGNSYLGIDAGSTTTKMVLMGEQNEILFTYYKPNKGNPIETVRTGLQRLYQEKKDQVIIAGSVVTGYGEKLIQTAFQIDSGEVETVAHYKAARQFQQDVAFIIDIGGQDMKCMSVRNGAIDRIILNEACSSGCGSFLENFADTLGLPLKEFVAMAVEAEAPVELGSRCTVFMNSRVKQVQKEGAAVADISAGLAYSVISNALFKVIKLRNVEDLGEHIVVQGGTFLNNAVLRAFEKMIGKEVVRPDLAGLMGAYGCAILAKERSGAGQNSDILPIDKIDHLTVKTSHGRCRGCENRCHLTITRFPDKRIFITGNRCERGAGKIKKKITVPNLMDEKLHYLFDRPSLNEKEAVRGTIGIPRALNMYENYPFWHRFFTELKFRVVLSDPFSQRSFEKGMETIPSEGVCYPAKLVHGHIINLVEKGVLSIFYPAVVYEKKESEYQNNHYNCPIVSSYPEVIRVNMAQLKDDGIRFIQPFLSLERMPALAKELQLCFPDIPHQELNAALIHAQQEENRFHDWIRQRGNEVIAELEQSGKKGIVVAGHPYHLDPLVNHGIPEEIAKMDMAVLTEDSVSHLDQGSGSQHIVNQWTYHSRLYRAAEAVKAHQVLELVQITSFGCGLDAITTDAVQEILESGNKLYTWIKMDENSNMGAIRIRLRSLKAAINERQKQQRPERVKKMQSNGAPVFEKKDKEEYTILAPQMIPTHFALFQKAFELNGYRFKILKTLTPDMVEEGLRYVNNDACYPAVITIGQLVSALRSGKYDLQRTAVLLTQTGGGCRATNYIALLKKALINAGYSYIPVISMNHSKGLERQPGFRITLPLIKKLVVSACLGDLLLRLRFAVRPYENNKGTTDAFYQKWLARCSILLERFSMRRYKSMISQMIQDFSHIKVNDVQKPKVGIVGEIYVAFSPFANNQLIDQIEFEGGEAVAPDFVNFFLYGLYNRHFRSDHFGMGKLPVFAGTAAIRFIEHYRDPIRQALLKNGRFSVPHRIEAIAERAAGILSIGNQMGEGWLLPGEMAELLDAGINNIICAQPFACLPNHILGRGMFHELKQKHPNANLVSIDYDPGSSRVNQENRIKLMISIAKNQLVNA
ncbi:2-hydroxyacyl-CoA dehydratase [Sporolactobacillus shoreicorticis]|uniref:Acyl-CoA dehydratase activase-related protein n=1 Tax=Sporolactobacillus shoreicorticis TaxID=1923877 RepID=A0ABW5SAY1_9BACL|nr:2-hydroxyacyl-CoA dehydratase [Sporolactobacillus shoreicorticis]MCO7126904.1 2-hydroxyacyl-CoA dehydratase [Sporolactobacillus shoreicorticis]